MHSISRLCFTLVLTLASVCLAADPDVPALPPLATTIELDPGETQTVRLVDGTEATVRLVSVDERRDSLRQALREARVHLLVNQVAITVTSATYRLPVTLAGVQIDCPVTRGYADARARQNVWALWKAARVRLWPAGSPWIQPGTFGYPLRQRWFASATQMANEPTFVNGDETPGNRRVYYHWGLDFGGAEGLVEVIAATDGLVVSAADQTLPAFTNSPAQPRADVIYLRDARDWYYRYSHLLRIDVKPGARVRKGQRLGLLGKEGGSGGWSHLHFDITSRQPSGEWGIQDAYAYVWEAYQREHRPALIAVARPHEIAAVGEPVLLDGTRSWSAAGRLERYEWQFTDGSSGAGATVKRTYTRPGQYSEILKITDAAGAVAWDFMTVQVFKPGESNLPPTIHAAYFPTTDLRPGDEVTFKVRTFRTTHGRERWDFGDGTPPVFVQSDGNARVHAPDGYAVTRHRYREPGRYIARVERQNERGETAVTHLAITVEPPFEARTRVSLRDGKWHLNNTITHPGTPAEGRLMNVRMVNATFEDRRRPDFDAEGNTATFLAQIPDYARHGVRAFTLCLQGGMPGYEGALNSAFNPDGSLREDYLRRVRRVIETCDREGLAVILGCFYQRQDQELRDAAAVRQGLVNVVRWIQRSGFRNVVIEIANEYDHDGFDHDLLRTDTGEIELIRLAKAAAPDLLVSTSGLGHGRYPDALAAAADFLLIHFNGVKLEEIPARIQALQKHGKPIVCNEDDKTGAAAARALELTVANGASYGLMLKDVNQYFPLEFRGAADDPVVYAKFKALTGN